MPRLHLKVLLLLLAGSTAISGVAQSRPTLSVSGGALPKALLWERYKAHLKASGGNGPYHWLIEGGSLPRSFSLDDSGVLNGSPDHPGEFEFTVLVRDANRSKQVRQTLSLKTETPLTADWLRKAQVNGQRIDGAVKVSNHTGRDFDLTFVVLAVNDIGRATAIGYQRFPLKSNTTDMEIPFGESLAPGNYAVNVDVVGEEPISQHIFRARLITGKESITQGL